MAKQETQTERSTQRGLNKKVIGRVTSTRMAKTISVLQERRVMHPEVKKHLVRSTVHKAHDEKGEAQEGDWVEIAQCRPLSKTKHWRLVRVVRRGEAPEAIPGAQQ